MGQVFSAHWIHLVWATKYREPLITANIKQPLYNKIREICVDKNYYLDFINGVADHIHILMGLKTTQTVAEIVKNIKGVSQNWANKNLDLTNYFSWQDGYAVISVSPSHVQKIRNYIKKQEKHHAHKSFDEELNNFENVMIITTDI